MLCALDMKCVVCFEIWCCIAAAREDVCWELVEWRECASDGFVQLAAGLMYGSTAEHVCVQEVW